MPAINPYLNFPGNTEDAFNFYKSVFGGEFLTLQRFKDTPDAGNLPAGVENQVMHVALPIGKNNSDGYRCARKHGFLTNGGD